MKPHVLSLHTIQVLFITIITYLYGKPYTILHCVVDPMDATIEMQARAHNETSHMLPKCSRRPISLQLHTYKQYLTNFISSINIQLLYIYGSN